MHDAYKILRDCYDWSTLLANANKIVRACGECQMLAGKQNLLPLPLKPIKVEDAFQLGGLDFIG